MNNAIKENEVAQKEKAGEIIQIVCFKLGDEEYALNIMSVQEVIHLVDIMKIPQMPKFVKGVINVRGDIMPVFDLRLKFNLQIKEFTKKARIIVVMVDGEKVSFIVDEIFETLRIESHQIDPAPAVRMSIKKECILGIGELENRMIILLDIKEIHKDIMDDITSFSSKWRTNKLKNKNLEKNE